MATVRHCWLAALLIASVAGSPAALGQAASRSEPTGAAAGVATPPDGCFVERIAVAGLALQARNCRYATGHWRVQVEPALPGLALWRDTTRVATVLQVFAKEPGAAVGSLLPALRAGGYIPDDGDCVFAPLNLAVAPAGHSLFDIRPTGRRLAAFQATPGDQIPDPPCGDYGWSTHGVRYFIVDAREPARVVYVNEGQDGTQIDPRTLAWERAGATR